MIRVVAFLVLSVCSAALFSCATVSSSLAAPPVSVGEKQVLPGADDTVTVRLKNGEFYPNVRISVNREYLVLTIRSIQQDLTALAPRTVSFDQIEAIVDAEGRDVTTSALGGYSPPKSVREPAPVEQRAGAARAAPRERARFPWKVAISASPAYTFPFGSWFEGTEASVGERFILTLGLTQEMGLDVGFQHQPLKIDEQFLSGLGALLGGLTGSEVALDAAFRLEKFFIAPRYMWKARSSPTYGYITAGLGGYQHRIRIKATIDGEVIENNTSETKLAIIWSAGAVRMLSSKVGIEMGGRLDTIYGTTPAASGVSYGFLFELSGGLVLALH